MPSTRDILAEDGFYTNTDFPFEVQALDENGDPSAITGFALSWLMKKRASDPDASAIITKTTGAGITITDGPNGICLIAVTADDTDATVKAGSYVHELKRTDAGNERVIVNGLAILLKSAHVS